MELRKIQILILEDTDVIGVNAMRLAPTSPILRKVKRKGIMDATTGEEDTIPLQLTTATKCKEQC